MTFTSVKRFMGRAPDEVAAEADLFKYDLDGRMIASFASASTTRRDADEVAAVLRLLHARASVCLVVLVGR